MVARPRISAKGPPTALGERRQTWERVLKAWAQLADSALLTLSELGYARTSLREIAQNSEFSHGVLHYYFRDKVDLITYCVREYKARCVTRYDQIAASATTADELRIGFAAGLAQTMAEDAHLHRLWYDLRGQSMFEASFREDVAAIVDRARAWCGGRVASALEGGYAPERVGEHLGEAPADPLLDGSADRLSRAHRTFLPAPERKAR